MKLTIRLPLLLAGLVLAASVSAQITFTKRTDLLQTPNYYSGVAIAVLDVNGDGLDDVVRMNQGFQLAFELQTSPNQPFLHQAIANLPGGSQWGMCAADIDNNGFGDVLAGGYYDGVKIARANDDGSAYTVTTLTDPETFVQGVNFIDINNDGWLDAFVCHDDGMSRIFGNDGTGNFIYQPNWMDLATVPVSDNSGNYGTVWSDVDNDGDTDLYIAKCRQGVNNPADGRRINQLFWNNGDGTYTQDVTNVSGLRIGAQSWTADFGDIDNDGDFDCFITNHDVPSQLLVNDGAGHFTDITASSGFDDLVGGLPIQGVFRDFDNDGYVDIVVAGSEHVLLRNNTDNTFSAVPNPFDNNEMESFAIGDLNNDGFQDIYGGYAEIYTDPSNIPDALWMNDGNGNHFLGFNLRGVQSNRSGVGAKVILYSALGTQVREVRSGESYGIMNSMQIHFGMGQLTAADSVVIAWPSGQIDKLYDVDADQYLTVQEGGCLVPAFQIEAGGPTTICSGESVAISAPAGFLTYAWSTGETSQNISVGDAGAYTVTVTVAGGCSAVSNSIAVTVDPVEIPSISAGGDTVFCAGNTVTLTASPATSWLWSNGETTQSITVGQSGAYTVTTQGLCAPFTSAPQQVDVLAPAAPSVIPDSILENETALLIASGDSLLWYDAALGGNLLATGSTFVTPPLTENTTYWVQNVVSTDQPNDFVGPVDHEGNALSGNQFNGALIFDCYAPCKLAKVKVYTATAGVRKIDLKNTNDDVLQSATVDIPVGTTVIDLNFDLPVATDLQLTTDGAVNQTNLGTVSPQLRRSDENVNYPYDLPGYISIKTSDLANDRYYYFYNWEIDFPGLECRSDLVPVTVVVDSDVAAQELQVAQAVRLSPNPTSGMLTAQFDGYAGGDLTFSVINAQGVKIQRETLSWPAGKASQSIDLGGMPKGVYWLEWAGAQGSLRRKVVVQ